MQIMYIATSPWRRENGIPQSTSWVWATQQLPSKAYCMGTGVTLQWRRNLLNCLPQPGDQGEHHLKSLKTACTPDVMWEGHCTLLSLSKPTLTIRENIWQIQVEGNSTASLSSPQNYQGHHKQGRSEKPSHPGGAWGDVRAKCYVGSWMASRDRKEH